MLAISSAGRAFGPECGYMHPGDIQWSLREVVQPLERVQLWERGGRAVGFTIIDPTGYVAAQVAPAERSSRFALLDSAERALPATAREVELSAYDSDPELRSWLTEYGYKATGSSSLELLLELSREPSPVTPAAGFMLRQLDAAEDDAYAALHRDAWSTWGPSSYTSEVHGRLVGMPGFRRDFIRVAVAPDGTLAASCIGWFDPPTRSVLIEPLGTSQRFRKLGLGRSVVLDLVRHSWESGALAIFVRGVDVNEAAVALYTSSGFSAAQVLREYGRPR